MQEAVALQKAGIQERPAALPCAPHDPWTSYRIIPAQQNREAAQRTMYGTQTLLSHGQSAVESILAIYCSDTGTSWRVYVEIAEYCKEAQSNAKNNMTFPAGRVALTGTQGQGKRQNRRRDAAGAGQQGRQALR